MTQKKFILSEEQIRFCKAVTFLFWWKDANELAANPERTLAGVMARGGMREWKEMEETFPPEFIVHVLESAKCGEFHGWSWKFWRLRYGLDGNAPLPSRMPGMPPSAGKEWFSGLQSRKAIKDEEHERLKWTFAVRKLEDSHDI